MGYEISKTGFADLPRGVISIDRSGYEITQAKIISGRYVHKNWSEIGATYQAEYVVYTGPVVKGQVNRLDDLVMLYPNRAGDASGNRYDVRITLKPTLDIPLAWNTPALTVARSQYNDKGFYLNPVGPVYTDHPIRERSIGYSIEVIVDILDAGQPLGLSTLVSMTGLDTPDNFPDGQQRYGVDGEYLMPYQESVYPLGDVRSPIYMTPDTHVITNAEVTGFGGSTLYIPPITSSIAYLVKLPATFMFTTSTGATKLFTQVADFAFFTIVSRAEEGGRISPNGSNEYYYGTSAPYTITPNYGWEIKDVLVDGVSAGAVTNYTFENIRANHTIVAKFERWLPPCEKTMEPMSLCGESKLFIPDC